MDIRTELPALTSLYIGYKPSQNAGKPYAGASDDMSQLSDFVSKKTFESWKNEGDCSCLWSMYAGMDIRVRIANSDFATFSQYVYEREELGHGMYTETFHTIDFDTGKDIDNKFLFKQSVLDKVERQLFEIMAKDGKILPNT